MAPRAGQTRLSKAVPIWSVVGYGIVCGAWAYAAKERGSFIEAPAATVAIVLLGLLVGLLVRQFWMFLSLVGPLGTLAYLEVTGFVGAGDWPNQPLLSPPGVFVLLVLALCLLAGRAAGEGVDWLRALRRRMH